MRPAGGVAYMAHIGGFVAGLVLAPMFAISRQHAGKRTSRDYDVAIISGPTFAQSHCAARVTRRAAEEPAHMLSVSSPPPPMPPSWPSPRLRPRSSRRLAGPGPARSGSAEGHGADRVPQARERPEGRAVRDMSRRRRSSACTTRSDSASSRKIAPASRTLRAHDVPGLGESREERVHQARRRQRRHLNGSTRFDFTNYFQVVPSHTLETVLWAEADRMKGLQITRRTSRISRES